MAYRKVKLLKYFYPEEPVEPLIIEGDDPPADPPPKDPPKEDIAQLKLELEKYKRDVALLKKKAKSEPSTPKEDTTKDEELKTVKEQLKQLEEEKERNLLKNKDQKDTDLFNANKRIRELENEVSTLNSQLNEHKTNLGDLDSKYTKQLQNLRMDSLKNEIYAKADQMNALRPAQIVNLTIGEFIWDDDVERWIYPIRNKKGEIVDGKDVDVYIKEYLSAEDNDNLIRAGVKSGTGEEPSSSATAPKSSTPPTKTTTKIVIDKKLERDAMMRDMDPKDWAELLQVRKEMVEKRKERRGY